MLDDAQTLCNRVQSHDGLAWHSMACREVRRTVRREASNDRPTPGGMRRQRRRRRPTRADTLAWPLGRLKQIRRGETVVRVCKRISMCQSEQSVTPIFPRPTL
jgi:hypothetical protein